MRGAPDNVRFYGAQGLIFFVLGNFRVIGHADCGDLDGLVRFADIAFYGGVEVVGCGCNIARIQRAGKSAR